MADLFARRLRLLQSMNPATARPITPTATATETPTLSPNDGPEDSFAAAVDAKVDEGLVVGTNTVADPAEVMDAVLSVLSGVLTVVLDATLYPFTGIPNTVVLEVRVVEMEE